MSKVSAMQAMREARYATRPATKAVVPTATVEQTWSRADPVGVDGAAVIKDAVVENAVVDDAVVANAVVGNSVSETSPVTLWPVGLETPEAEDMSKATVAPQQEEAPEQEEALCGHRSMNNRKCRRPAGHPEKNHRYS